MRFSIVVPTFNRQDTIGRALSSVLAQHHQDWELLVVDDGSSDDTARVVRELTDDQRVRYVARTHAGVAPTRNVGASLATGSYLTFLDSDDEVDERWLADFAELIDQPGGEVGYVSCGYRFDGHRFPPTPDEEFSEVPYHSLAGTFALRRSVFVDVGGYDEALRQSENWELALRALERCQQQGLRIAHTTAANMVFWPAKSRSQLRARAYDRANAYLHLHQKYEHGGVLHGRRQRFLTGAAVNFVRSGHLEESRRCFRQNLRRYPSLGNLARLVCFEIPFLRNRFWNRRRLAIEITDD